MQSMKGTIIKRLINLVHSIRQIGMLLTGERIRLTGEGPAVYLGSWEEGDLQREYIQLHVFRLHDGVHVILESPSLNRALSKFLF